jgi:hypothetical protein
MGPSTPKGDIEGAWAPPKQSAGAWAPPTGPPRPIASELMKNPPAKRKGAKSLNEFFACLKKFYLKKSDEMRSIYRRKNKLYWF